MALFNPAYYGGVISQELSDYMTHHTSRSDLRAASSQTNVNIYDLKDVLHRTHALTKESADGLIALMRIAIKNRNGR